MAKTEYLDDLYFKYNPRETDVPIAQPSMDPRLDTPLSMGRHLVERKMTPDTYNQEATMYVLGVENLPTGEPLGAGNAVSDLTPLPQVQAVQILRCKVLGAADTDLIPNPPNWQAHANNEDSILGSLNQVLVDTTYPAIRYRPSAPGVDPVVGDIISARYDRNTYRTGYFTGYPPESNKIIPPGVGGMGGGLGGLFGALVPYGGTNVPGQLQAPGDMMLGQFYTLYELTKPGSAATGVAAKLGKTPREVAMMGITQAHINNLKQTCLTVLDPMCRLWGKANISIGSAYRSQIVNDNIPGAAARSKHMDGLAIDCSVKGYNRPKQRGGAASLAQHYMDAATQGLGGSSTGVGDPAPPIDYEKIIYYYNEPGKGHIHVTAPSIGRRGSRGVRYHASSGPDISNPAIRAKNTSGNYYNLTPAQWSQATGLPIPQPAQPAVT